MLKRLLISHGEAVPGPSRSLDGLLPAQRPPAIAHDTWDLEKAGHSQAKHLSTTPASASPFTRCLGGPCVYSCLRGGCVATLGFVAGASAGALVGALVGSCLARVGTFLFVRHSDADAVISAALTSVVSHLVGAAAAVVGGAGGAALAVKTFST